MRTSGLLVVIAIALAVATWLIVSGWRQPRPTLDSSVQRLRRATTATDHVDSPHPGDIVGLIGGFGARSALLQARFGSSSELRIIGRPLAIHIGYLTLAGLAGLVVPSLAAALLTVTGIGSFGLVVPAGMSLLAMLAAPTIVHSAAIARADEIRVDLRHQLSAYLDMVTMLLAGNTGHEGALEQAAAAGDGILFRELRRRMREVSTTGTSLVNALDIVADDFDLVELEQVAAAAALSAAQGAPVARTLAAKCATLRSTLAADDEASARVRNDKVTPPLVGMALLFMALIIYPALNIG